VQAQATITRPSPSLLWIVFLKFPLSQPRQLERGLLPCIGCTGRRILLKASAYLGQVEPANNKMVPSVDDSFSFDLTAEPFRRANEDIKRFLAFAPGRAIHCLQEEAEAAGICGRKRLEVKDIRTVKPL
jgi:hypothetical protein